MNARTLLLSCIALPFALALAHGQVRRITTHTEPAFLFADSAAGHVHVLTAGLDANFDGIFEADSGDILPRWFVIDAASEKVVDSATFADFFSSFPIRPGVDLGGRRLYVSQLGRIRAYDLDTRALVRDTVINGYFSGVSFDSVANTIVVHERPSYTDPGWIMIADPATGDTLAHVRVGVSPSMTVSWPTDAGHIAQYYTLSEGQFNMPNSLLSYTLAQTDIYQKMNGRGLGSGGSYIAVKGDLACIALGGGHSVNVIDTRTHTDLPYSPVSFGPAGQNGPRTLEFQGDSVLLVGTYEGTLVRMRLADGALLDTMKFAGKVESIGVHDSLAFVALRTGLAGNAADSEVVVVNLNSHRAVDTLHVGIEPIAVVIAKNGDIHVIGAGLSDSTHWWVAFDAATLQPKAAHIFSGALDNPFRTVYDAATDTVYAVVSGTLRAFPAASAGADSRAVYTPVKPYGKLTGVSDGGEYLLVNESAGTATGLDYLHVVDKQGNLVARFKTGLRPTMAARVTPLHPKAVGMYVLDRGAPGAQASGLDLYEYQPNILGSDTLGMGANHITMLRGVAGITMNSNHSFLTVNPITGDVIQRVSTGTTGFDGPREGIFIDKDHVAVTTYAGDVRVLQVRGAPQIVPIGGKGEGITMLGGKVFVASAFKAGTYTPDSDVVVLDAAPLLASVEREGAVATAATALEQNYPNPASSGASIRFAVEHAGHVTLALYSESGELLNTMIDRAMESGSYVATLDVSSIPSGSYLYTLRCGTTVASRIMKVVR